MKGSSKRKNIKHEIEELQMNINSVADISQDQEINSPSDYDITQIDTEHQIKRNWSEEIQNRSILAGYGFQSQPLASKISFEPITINYKKHTSLIKISAVQSEPIDILCFGWKRILIPEAQFEQFRNKKSEENGGQIVYCWHIIEEVVKKICISEFNFQPLTIRVETFQIFLIEQVNGSKIQINITDEDITKLCSWKKLQLRRAPRLSSLVVPLQPCKQKKQEEILEILSPDERDIVEPIDRNSTIGNIKQKIARHYYQIIGQIILISYSQFKIIDNRTKLSDLSEKVLQIYQKKHVFIDPSFVKTGQIGYTSGKHYEVQRHDNSNGNMPETVISQNWMNGRLTLQIEDKKLIEKYTGGAVGYFQNDRVKSWPLITLIAVKICHNSLLLQFKTKDGTYICQYDFNQQATLRQVLTNILVVTRIFNHHIQILT